MMITRREKDCGQVSPADKMQGTRSESGEVSRDRGQVSSSGRSQVPQARLLPFAEERASVKRGQRRSLVSLCVGVLGRHLEDILDEISTIAQVLPASLKMTLLAIARRRGLLGDEMITALADESWETLDVSGSDVTDIGIQKVGEKCHLLKAVDISRCSSLTSLTVRALVQHCPMLHTLRCGGTALSDATARNSLNYVVPGLNIDNEAEDSWENLETKQVGRGAVSLRWLVWPSIDEESRQRLLLECPRVVVNPTSSPTSYRCLSLPEEALPDTVLDFFAVNGIDPETWATRAYVPRLSNFSSFDTKFGSLSIAERFKLAFAERDERLAPKRAKNLRQNQRRAEKAWLESDARAKSLFWAGIAQKSLRRLA